MPFESQNCNVLCHQHLRTLKSCIFSLGHLYGSSFSSPPLTYQPRSLTDSLPRLSALPASFSLSVDLDNRSYSQGDSDSSTSSGLFARQQSLASSLPTEPSTQKPGKSSFFISSMFNKLSSRKSRLMVLPLSQSEVNERFKKLLNSAVDIVVHAGMIVIMLVYANTPFHAFYSLKMLALTYHFLKLNVVHEQKSH